MQKHINKKLFPPFNFYALVYKRKNKYCNISQITELCTPTLFSFLVNEKGKLFVFSNF